LVTSALRDTGSSITALGELGIRFDGTTGQLTFNETTFEAKYAGNKDDITKFFSDTTNGFVKKFGEMVDDLTESEGLFGDRVTNLSTAINRQQESLDRFNARIDVRQTRLQREFAALELSIFNIQSQQSALNSLANLAAQTAGGIF
jgi:flagellar capping protein FliD